MNKQKIFEKAKRIVLANDLSWEEKYHLIFSKDISHHFDLDYYDPDTSYQEDTLAFMTALIDYMERINKYLE